MAITLSVTLQKGGVGKTTTAETISAIWGTFGNKVLLVDFDPQCNSTFISGISDPSNTITDVLTGDSSINNAICKTAHYDILPADEYLANLEQLSDVDPLMLKGLLSTVQNNYDFIIIDTPPALGNLLKCSLMASDYALVVTDARPLSIRGLDALKPTLDAAAAASGRLKILGIVLVKYHERTILNRQIKDLLNDVVKSMDTCLFSSYIREGIAVPESQALQMSLIDYAPRSNPCLDYISLSKEILDRIER